MKLTIQWHITEQCNWRCTHCYHDDYLDAWPSLEKLKSIFDEIVSLNKSFNWDIKRKSINLAWWEPFIRKDFLDLLKYINSKVKYMRIWILTNGSLITKEILEEIKKLNKLDISFQISIEGTQKVNDEIRWKWTFNKINKVIQLIKRHGLKVRLSFTLTNKNKNEVVKLIPFLNKHEITLYTRRFVPMWQSKQEYDLLLSSEDWYKLSVKIFKLNNTIFKDKKYNIALTWCSETTSYKYSWQACAVNYHRILLIMHNLDVYSCRRLPITIWNLEKENLGDVYLSNEYKKQIDSSEQILLCKKCPYNSWCKWWSKCITYAVKGTLEKEDPQCYFAKLLKEK